MRSTLLHELTTLSLSLYRSLEGKLYMRLLLLKSHTISIQWQIIIDVLFGVNHWEKYPLRVSIVLEFIFVSPSCIVIETTRIFSWN